MNNAFLAMAHQRLGHDREARRWLGSLQSRMRVPYRALRTLSLLQEQRLLLSETEAVVIYDPVFPADPFAR